MLSGYRHRRAINSARFNVSYHACLANERPQQQEVIAAPLSPRSIAKIKAPMLSPTNKVPSGPKAKEPTDLIPGVPSSKPYLPSATAESRYVIIASCHL